MRFLLLILLSCLSIHAQTVLVDSNSDDPTIFGQRAVDVMSFYLQEQGIKVIFREENECDVSEVALSAEKRVI